MTAKFDPSLLDVLVCPADKSSLSLAPQTLVDELNSRIEARTLRTRLGTLVQSPLLAGLVREDRRYFYPIVDGVPLLTREDAIELAEAN